MQINSLTSLNFGKIYYKTQKKYTPTNNQLNTINNIKNSIDTFNLSGIIDMLDSQGKDIFVISKRNGAVELQLREKNRAFNDEFHPGRRLLIKQFTTPESYKNDIPDANIQEMFFDFIYYGCLKFCGYGL